jgi:protein SCO1/2
MKLALVPVVLSCVVGAAAPGICAQSASEGAVSANPSLSVIAHAPDFTLRDPTGKSVRLSDYQGRVVLLAFVFTTCPGVCPLISKQMAALQNGLKQERLFGARESPEKTKPVLKAYDEWTKLLPKGELDHPARVYLIDQKGNIREIYSLAFFNDRQALIDMRKLVLEPGA